MIDPTTTHWTRVALLVGAGIAAAVHIGKVPGALPVVATDLQLDLGTSALLTAIYSLVAAAGGLFFGLGARRYGAKPLVVAGLSLASIASLGGAMAPTDQLLLVSRIIEGLGFILVAVAAPTLIIAATHPSDRRLALGLWGTYVPAGSSLMMLVTAATLSLLGWRGVWALSAAISGAMALTIWVGVRDRTPASQDEASGMKLATSIADAFTPASCWLAACFVVYGAQYLAVTAFLPLLLVETAGLSVAAAGLCGAAVAASNILGNIAAGWLGARGWRPDRVVAIGALGMGIGSIPIFATAAPVWLKVVSAMLFCAIGGLIPGTLLGAAPRVARTPGAAAAVVGLMIQGAGIGQLLGPPIFAAIVKGSGSWSGAWIFTISAALLLLALAPGLRPAAAPVAAKHTLHSKH